MNSGAYLFEEGREWQSVVSSEGPDLPGGGGNLTDDGGDESDDDNGGQYVGAGKTVGHIVEMLDEGIACVSTEDSRRVGDSEAECEDGDIAQKRIQSYTPHDGPRKSFRSILDFFGC